MSQSNRSISFQPIGASSLEQLYQPIEQIGRGSFAEVIKARQIKGNKIRAIKRIQLNPLLQEVNKQVARLKILKADHIIQFYGYINAQDSNELNIIMHLCKGSLRDQLKKNKKFSMDQIISLITQITSAMLVLSQKFTMHLDLKPQNILYEQENYYKICDFGCSQFFYNLSKYSKLGNCSKKVSNLQYQIKDCLFGTPQYIAPEIQLGVLKVGTNSCDVWSFGVILYEIIYGKYPFKLQQNGRVKNSQFAKFVKKQIQIKYEKTIQNYPIQLIKQMLRPNPTQRIKWRQIKQKLIKQYGCHQAEFLDLQKAADTQIKMSSIYGEIIMLIQNNTAAQNIPGIWQKYKKQFLQIKYTLILLGYSQLQNFFKLFSYKIQHKLNKTSLTNINFLFENLREQVYALYQANTQLDIYNHIQLQQMLRQKLMQLQQQTKQIKVPDVDFEKIKIFIYEVLNSSTLFCNGDKFRKSCEVLNIIQIK